jgi:nicotinamidase-related amidase
MNKTSIANAALLIIDVQKGFDDPKWGQRNNPDAEDNIVLLLKVWRSKNLPVIHIQHCSTEPGSPLRPDRPGNQFKKIVLPKQTEIIFQKTVHSAFIGTNLEKHLRNNHITTVVIVGLTTNHCVSTTARMAGNLGFDTIVVSDATATFDRTGPDGTTYDAEVIHNTSLANLHDEFAQIITTHEIIDSLKNSKEKYNA